MRFLGGEGVYRAVARLLGIVTLAGLLCACFPKTEQPVFTSIDGTPLDREFSYAPKRAETAKAGTEGMYFKFSPLEGSSFAVESYTRKKDGKLDASLFAGRLVKVAQDWFVLELGDEIGKSQRNYVLTKWSDTGFSAYAPLDNTLMSGFAARHGIILGKPNMNDGGTLSGNVTSSTLKALFGDAAAHIDRGDAPKPAMQLDYVSVPTLPDNLAADGREHIFNWLSVSFAPRLRAALPEDKKLVWSFMEKLAAANEPWGNYFLARFYANGISVTADLEKARTYAQQAVAAGFARAKLVLGFLLRQRSSPTQADEDKAYQFFLDAASAGDATAMTNLAVIFLDSKHARYDTKNGYSWQERAATAGEANAIYMVGLRLRDGTDTPQSASNAFQAMSIAAKLFHPDALAELGRMYEKGQGTTADDALALAQYREAARLGNAWAQWQLGDRLLSGRGLSGDRAQGLAWLEKAAANGSVEAADQLKLATSPEAEMEEMERKVSDFLQKKIDRLDQELICLDVGERCKLNNSGKALLQLRHQEGWYYPDGEVASRSEWPQ